MKIALDKDSFCVFKNDGNEYIYLFDKEPLSELLNKGIKCVHYKQCNFVDINLSRFNIDCMKQAKITDKDCLLLPEKKDYKIAIIIPNCNYAEFLEKCFNSILNQTYQNFEIIFVDDMSTDDSVKVAKKLLKPPHKIIELKQKRLNGGARNEAYLHVSDDVDYIWYVDSDDWVRGDDVLEKINNKLQGYPDVLFLGMAYYKNGKETICFTPQYKDKYEAMEGWSGSCGKVIKKSLATRQDNLYNEGTLKEDRNHHRRICIHMNSFKLLKDAVYVWNRENSKSVTTVRDKATWGVHTIRQYADTLQLYLLEKGKDPKVDEILKKCVDKTKNEMGNGGDKQY